MCLMQKRTKENSLMLYNPVKDLKPETIKLEEGEAVMLYDRDAKVVTRKDGEKLKLYGTDYEVNAARELQFMNGGKTVLYEAQNESGTYSVGEALVEDVYVV